MRNLSHSVLSSLWKDAGVPSLQMAFGSVSSCLNKLVAEEKERVRSRRWEGESLISTVLALVEVNQAIKA